MAYVHFYVTLNQVWFFSYGYIYYFMYYVRNESLQTEICDNVTRNTNTDHSPCLPHRTIVDNGNIQNSTSHNGISTKYNTAPCRFSTSNSVQYHSPQQDESFLYIITNSTSCQCHYCHTWHCTSKQNSKQTHTQKDLV